MGKQRKPKRLSAPEPVASQSVPQEEQQQHHSSKSKKNSSRQLVQPRPEWHATSVPDVLLPNSLRPVPTTLLETVHKYANSLLEVESSTYAATKFKSSSSHKFMATVMSSGTRSDKVSALTLIVQESPLHTRKQFESLLGLAAKRSRDQALMALGAIKDMICQGTLLPSDRKLRAFNKQPGLLAAFQEVKASWTQNDPLPNRLQESHLLLWAYEDWLKHSYLELLKILERWCGDEVEFARLRSVTFIWELLKEKPEQEENLLRLLVNKLGDTNKKVASRTSHLLLQLQVVHPSMKSIVVGAIESDALLRPGQTLNAKYYAVITLNQTILSIADPGTANKLLDVYFSVFVAILNRSKANKAAPPKPKTHSKDRKRDKHALKQSDSPENTAEKELEDKITAQVLTGINRAFPYSKTDGGDFEKHLDTMFRIAHSSNFNTSIQALLLIQQITSTHHISTDRFMRTLYESLLDPRLLNSSKQTLYLNLLYRSLKSDASTRRVQAFVKRLLQILSLHEPPFICGVLYLVQELQTMFPSIKTMLDQPEVLDEDDEETFHDAPDPDDPHQQRRRPPPSASKTVAYDPRKRDPSHSNADRACLWELLPWCAHYHPSVTLFATHLLHPSPSSTNPPPKPDPTSHTLSHFLDRFAYRNPKTKHLTSASSSSSHPLRGPSLMQPALASTHTTTSLVGAPAPSNAKTDPLNAETFWSRRADEIAPHEAFFHRYFSAVAPGRRRARERKEKSRAGGRDAAEMDEEGWDPEVGAGEGEIWRALVGSNAELDGDGDAVVEDGFEHDDVEGLDGGYEDGEEGMFDDDDDYDDVDVDVDDVDQDEGGDTDVELNLESDDDDDYDEAEAPGPEPAPTSKRKLPKNGGDEERGQKKKRKMANLPTFASADDYADMLD